ncbi:phage tail tape measure protein [Serratia sp. DD3]|uniref:phage tail tape measure protein n=1 Tax=Serratia sp. DD3 TaxID=1410619 RepID=UPI0003C4F1CE|nr:phage tail tape measure protein [Serratia sp. DD3]KEY58508.1 phage tail tape measure protein, lambda family [Serratia sp. DD3]
MASLRELIIKISANASSFKSEISRASRMGADYYKTMEQGGRKAAAATRQQQQAIQALNTELASVAGVAAGLTGVVAGAFAVDSLITTADNWGQLSSRIKMATGSADEYNLVQQRLMEISDRTYKPIEEQSELFIRSAKAMQELGYNTAGTIDFIDSISSSLTINAASAEKGARTIDAMSKSMVTGKVSGDEWKTVMEVMPTVIGDIGRYLGITETAVKKLASEGKLSMQTFSDAVIAAQKRNAELADAMPTTVGDAITKLSNHWKKYVGETNEAHGTTQALSAGIGHLADNINTVATVTGLLIGVGVSRYFGGMAQSISGATIGVIHAQKSEVALAAAQVEGTKVAVARAKAAEYRAQKALIAARGTDGQAAAERRLAGSQAAVTRNIAARTAAQTALNSVTSVGSRLMSGALGLVGGIPGLLMLGAGAWYYMYQQQEQARASAQEYAAQIDQVREKVKTMSLSQTADEGKNAQKALVEQNRLIDEQAAKVKALQKDIETLNQARANPSYSASIRDADLVDGIAKATSNLAVEQSRLSDMQSQAKTIQEALSGIEEQRNSLISKSVAEQSAAYNSLLMMTGEHTEFNRVLGIGNQLLASRQGLLANGPLRLPQATVTDSEQQALLQKQQAAELAGFDGVARVTKQAEFDLLKMGKTGPENATFAAEWTQAAVKEHNETQRLSQAKKAGTAATSAHNKAENEAARTAEQYSRKIADLSIAVDVQRVRATQGEKAAELYAASHENGAKWTNEQRKAIESSAVELATWTQKADEAVRKQREMADALKDLTDAARKYSDEATASKKARGMGQRQRDYFDERQQVERIFDKSDKGTEAFTAKAAALDALDSKYKAAKAAEADWMAGVSAGMADWVDEASNYAGQAASATNNAMSGMVTNITEMLNDNKASWKDWSISVLKEIEKVLVNAAMVGVIKSVAGGMMGSLGGAAASSGSSAFSSGAFNSLSLFDGGGYTGSGGKYDPAGIVHRGEFVIPKEATERIGVENLYALMHGNVGVGDLRGYANGGLVSPALSPSLNVRPTTANLPPAMRDAASNATIVNITINNDGQSTVSTPPGMEQFGNELAQFVDQRFKSLLQKETGQGRMLSTAIKGRR